MFPNENPPENPLIGGRYRIINKLGEGSFGETYKAVDTSRFNETVVVKRLMIESFSEHYRVTARDLFEREAATYQQLGSNHSQIPRLEAYFVENDNFYLVMEYIAESNLSEQELRENNILAEEQVIKLLKSILQILEFVHSRNLVHRDIKPNNLIRRNSDQQIVLIDFGSVTRDLNIQNRGNTGRKTTLGSTYAAPEQFCGEAYPCSDIYAVGMIGIQALTGRLPENLPKDPTTGERIWEQLTSASDSLKRVIRKMVYFNTAQRYQSVDEVLTDLDKIDNQSSEPKTSPSIPVRPIDEVLTDLDKIDNQSSEPKTSPSILVRPIIATLSALALLSIGIYIYCRLKSPLFPMPDLNGVMSGTTVKIAGSVSMVSLNNGFKKGFEQAFPAKTTVDLGLYNNRENLGSNKGIELLCQGKVDIAALSESVEDGKNCPGTSGKKIFTVLVGTDSLSVYVHHDNPINNLTKSQVKDIAQCRITKWSDLNPNWPGQKSDIEFLNRPSQGGTQNTFQTLFLDRENFCPTGSPNSKNFRTLPDDEFTHTNQNFTINQISYGSYEHTKFSGIKRLSIDGVKPEEENYPYKRPLFYAYLAEQKEKPHSQAVKQFLGFVLNSGKRE